MAVMVLLALVAMAGALGVALAPGTILAAAALLGLVAANAALFWSLGAPGLAAAQLLGYGAAIALVYHLAYWRNQPVAAAAVPPGRRYWGALVMTLAFILLVRVLGASEWGQTALASPLAFGLGHALALGAALLAIGLFGAVSQRDGIRAGMALQVALNAILINMVAFSHFLPASAGGFGIAVMGIGVVQALLGTILLRRLATRCGTVDLDAFDAVRG